MHVYVWWWVSSKVWKIIYARMGEALLFGLFYEVLKVIISHVVSPRLAYCLHDGSWTRRRISGLGDKFCAVRRRCDGLSGSRERERDRAMRGGRQQRSDRGTTIGKANVVLIGNTLRGGSHSLTLRGVVWKSFTMIPSSNLHCLFSFWSISFKTMLGIYLNDMQVCVAFYYRMMYDDTWIYF